MTPGAFAARLTALLAGPPPDVLAGTMSGRPDRLAVAVSGGPDSMALLWLTAQAFGDRTLALTIDHGLRTESAAEAAMVAAHCASHGIAHRTLTWTGPWPDSGVQGAARDARYALLASACADAGASVLMTAHHADDQAETLLMRLARGAGAAGLAGIRAVRPLTDAVQLVRPLLDQPRTMLHALVAGAGWPSVSDPGNARPEYLRTHARALLATTDWLPAAGLARAADNLAMVEAALAWAADRAWAGAAVATPGGIRLDLAELPVELRHRMIRRALAELAPAASLRGPDIARLAAGTGATATLAGVRVRRKGAIWSFTSAPPRRDSRGKSS